jgi:RimJ/RimL family protein N-acetyltransferase
MYLKVKDAAKENNVSQIRLYVEKTNLSAQKVYQNVGMRESHYLMFEEYIKCLH